MMGHSLAEDGDLTYRARISSASGASFQSGPTGVFLKKGSDIVDGGLMLRPPFFWTTTAPIRTRRGSSTASRSSIRCSRRRSCGCSARTASWCCNALLLALVRLVRLPVPARAHAGRWPAAMLAAAFVMATVVPGVFRLDHAGAVQLLAGSAGVFLLALQGSRSAREHAPRGTRWLFGRVSDVAAACCSASRRSRRSPNALLFPPIVRVARCGAAGGCRRARRRRGVRPAWRRAVRRQHGDLRRVELPGRRDAARSYFEFPFQNRRQSSFDVGRGQGRDEALTDVIFNRSVFLTNLPHNLEWFFVGRYAGLVAYFFPGGLRAGCVPARAPRDGRAGSTSCSRRRWRRS